MPIVIDWTIPVVAFVSLTISLMTLYLAHLRGPSVSLATSGKVYPCHGFSYDPARNSFTVSSRLLVANTGNRSGVLFSFRLDPANEHVLSYHLDPQPEKALPLPLPPGDGWTTCVRIEFRPKAGPWEGFLARIDTLQMQAVFSASASFGRVQHKRIKLKIDLKPVQASAPEILAKRI